MLWFTMATAVPVFLLTLAGLFGGVWAIVALLPSSPLFKIASIACTKDVALSVGSPSP